ncbi:DUF1569 domain-containing protein [Flavobacterium rhizosphaerae]|uniref:DUF1569 domain-containing protein n=1 Tax=Flavobacterium rhizosphaerae TaxID=3163298 RepID=A0ABW8YTY0_9FLAO
MQSLFDPNGNRIIIERIDQLTPIVLSQWGKMTVSQMLLHCQMPIKVAFGEMEIKPNWFLKTFFGRSSKKMFIDSKPLRHDLPTSNEFKITHEPDFDQAKEELKALVKQFTEKGPAVIKIEKHPLFGKMTMEEWDMAQYNHLDHHLRQFGV